MGHHEGVIGLLAAAAAASVTQMPAVVTATTTFRPGVTTRENDSVDGSSAALVIKGNGITVDFGGHVLRGTPPETEPDQRRGVGVRVEGSNVTIKNLRVHGYKVGLFAKNAAGLRIVDSDFSYNWKQRLMSTLEREDLSDWMSFHRNEKDEWMRFGAGIYLRNSDGAHIERVRIVGGQCGLMITETDGATIVNNNFSFLSAVGLGMYLSSHNRILHNKIDWCVRGYSHGVYNRGQDSTGILIYEQSNKNVFAYNSVTHGGDGFFLWAGQTTMDTGRGGCNDNLLVGNDWSHAPTNGIEATFSRNAYVNNLVMECWHGGWLGYSFDSLVWRNTFALNAEAIAWEHGQDNRIIENTFFRDNEAIVLWQNLREDPNWVYPQRRDTRSRDNVIARNTFSDIPSAVVALRNTTNVSIEQNVFRRNGEVLRSDERAKNTVVSQNRLEATQAAWDKDKDLAGASWTSRDISARHEPLPRTMQPSGNVILGVDPETSAYLRRFNIPWNPWNSRDLQPEFAKLYKGAPAIPAPLKGGQDPFLKPGQLRGRRYILVDEWGPYDFQSPRLWPRAATKVPGGTKVRYEVLGPRGQWSVKGGLNGASLSAQSGTVPGFVEAVFPDSLARQRITLEYVGAQTTDYRGVVSPAGAKVPFGFDRFRAPISWKVRHFNFDLATEDPRTNYEGWLKRAEKSSPVRETMEINESWWRSPAEGIGENTFGTIAEGTFTIEAGEYTLNVTSDDGVRVWIDGRKVLENWTYHGPTLDTAKVKLGGSHTIRVEHFELDGFSTLKVALEPAK